MGKLATERRDSNSLERSKGQGLGFRVLSLKRTVGTNSYIKKAQKHLNPSSLAVGSVAPAADAAAMVANSSTLPRFLLVAGCRLMI